MWLDISTDFGQTWTNLRYQTVDDPPGVGNIVGGTFEVENLAPYIGYTVILRWRFTTEATKIGWYWYVDNVSVQTTVPVP